MGNNDRPTRSDAGWGWPSDLGGGDAPTREESLQDIESVGDFVKRYIPRGSDSVTSLKALAETNTGLLETVLQVAMAIGFREATRMQQVHEARSDRYVSMMNIRTELGPRAREVITNLHPDDDKR